MGAVWVLFSSARRTSANRPVAEAAHPCGLAVNTFGLEIDDAWTRDTDPASLRADDGSSAAAAWRFNGRVAALNTSTTMRASRILSAQQQPS